MINQEILNYVIIRKIGEGGMGQVFLAKNKSIHQFVAIKMLHPRFSANPALRDRFRQEAIMLSTLNHPGIVQFLNYVENEQGIFLIMEYVDGMTLEDYINNKSGLIVEDRALPMMRQILDAFAYAHGRGIIHRDIKPSNILISRDGTPKVLDFGIAQIMSESEGSDIKGGGTVDYMSPEQALDRQLGIRSDIYSLGVLFYQMLTGRPPYNTKELSSFDIKKKIIEEPLPRMSLIYPYISDRMQKFVDKATAKNPDERYRNCREMLAALPNVPKNVSDDSTKTNDPASVNIVNSSTPQKKKIWPWIIGGIVLLVIAGAGFAYWIMDRNSVKYYADYTEKWEKPEGIKKISAADTLNYPIFYEFRYKDGDVVRVIRKINNEAYEGKVDSLLSLVHCGDVEYEYNKGPFGKDVARKILHVADSLPLVTVSYGSALVEAEVEYAIKDEKDSLNSKKITFALNRDDTNGLLKSVYRLDDAGNYAVDADSISGYGFTYDSKNRIERLTYLDKSGNTRANGWGVAYVSYEYDQNGKLERAETYDEQGKPAIPKKKVEIVPVKSVKKSPKKHLSKEIDMPKIGFGTKDKVGPRSGSDKIREQLRSKGTTEK